MSSITRLQYSTLVSVAEGYEPLCTEHDRDQLEALDLIHNSQWVSSSSHSSGTDCFGWLRAQATFRGEELIAAKQEQAA